MSFGDAIRRPQSPIFNAKCECGAKLDIGVASLQLLAGGDDACHQGEGGAITEVIGLGLEGQAEEPDAAAGKRLQIALSGARRMNSINSARRRGLAFHLGRG